jgi:oxygen-dependent protoporphyrinogen oxidase
MDELERTMADYPGLFLAGASYRGIGVPDCIRQAQETAERIARAFSHRDGGLGRQEQRAGSDLSGTQA